MTNLRRKYKTGITLGIIGLSLIILDGIIGAIALLDRVLVYQLLESLLMLDTTISIEEMYQFFDVIQIVLIFISLIAALLCIPGIIFLSIAAKDSKCDVNTFQSRTKKHVLALVFLGVAFVESSNAMGSIVLAELSVLSIAETVLCILSFVFILSEVRMNKRYFDNQVFVSSSNVEEAIDVEDKKEEDPFAQYRQEETQTQEDKNSLEELYELLSKLEKQYKNNELSEEDYKRMKQTIIDNYYKN